MIKVFNKAKSTLQSIPAIQHVGLFRNQFRNILEGEEIPFLFPAALLEFQDVRYTTNTDKTQTGEGILRVYLAEDNLVQSDEEFFELRETVHKALQGLRDEDYFSGLNRVAENADPDFERLQVWYLDYEVKWSDNSARPTYSEVTPDLRLTRS